MKSHELINYIYNFTQDNGYLPRQSHLAREFGVSREMMRKYFNKLEEKHFIKRLDKRSHYKLLITLSGRQELLNARVKIKKYIKKNTYGNNQRTKTCSSKTK